MARTPRAAPTPGTSAIEGSTAVLAAPGIPPEVHENPGLAIAPRMDATVLAVDTLHAPHASRGDARSKPPRCRPAAARRIGSAVSAARPCVALTYVRSCETAEGRPTLPT